MLPSGWRLGAVVVIHRAKLPSFDGVKRIQRTRWLDGCRQGVHDAEVTIKVAYCRTARSARPGDTRYLLFDGHSIFFPHIASSNAISFVVGAEKFVVQFVVKV